MRIVRSGGVKVLAQETESASTDNQSRAEAVIAEGCRNLKELHSGVAVKRP
jgi:hypothetical protein